MRVGGERRRRMVQCIGPDKGGAASLPRLPDSTALPAAAPSLQPQSSLTVHARDKHADVLGDAVYLGHTGGVGQLVRHLVLQW